MLPAPTIVPTDPTAHKSSSCVLVTGATGFLGRAVAEALDRAGQDVLRGARTVPEAAPAGERWIGYGEVGPATRWEEALAVAGDPDFDVGFLKQEWALVVQSNGITTLPEYLKVPRTGRGRRRPWRNGTLPTG